MWLARHRRERAGCIWQAAPRTRPASPRVASSSEDRERREASAASEASVSAVLQEGSQGQWARGPGQAPAPAGGSGGGRGGRGGSTHLLGAPAPRADWPWRVAAVSSRGWAVLIGAGRPITGEMGRALRLLAGGGPGRGSVPGARSAEAGTAGVRAQRPPELARGLARCGQGALGRTRRCAIAL